MGRAWPAGLTHGHRFALAVPPDAQILCRTGLGEGPFLGHGAGRKAVCGRTGSRGFARRGGQRAGCRAGRVPDGLRCAAAHSLAAVLGRDRLLGYSWPIQPIFDRRCVRCHGPEKAFGGIDLSGAVAEDGFLQSFCSKRPADGGPPRRDMAADYVPAARLGPRGGILGFLGLGLGDRGGFQGDAAGAAWPSPSTRVTSWSAWVTGKTSRRPPIQRTSMRSTRWRGPRPKCKREPQWLW